MQSWALWDAVLLLLSFHVPAMSLELIEFFKSTAVNCFHYKEKPSLLCSFCKGPKCQWGTRLSKHGKAWFSKSGKTRPTANLSKRQRSVEVIRLPRPPRQTDNLGNLEGKRAEATTTGAGSGKRQKSRHVATIAPLPRLLAIIGRAVVARDIDWLHFTPNINIWELFDLPKMWKFTRNCLKQENIYLILAGQSPQGIRKCSFPIMNHFDHLWPQMIWTFIGPLQELGMVVGYGRFRIATIATL